MGKKAYFGLLILTVSLVILILFIGNFIWGEIWQAPNVFKYDILKDTLTITLTVLGVGIAVVGYLIYRILAGRLEIESASASRLETVKGSVRLLIHAGFVFWENYDKAEQKEDQHLEIAIGLTERALLFHNQLPEREAQNRENDRSLCLIKNNLAYYLALRKRPGDKGLAKEYAEYIRKRASKYSKEMANWLETCDFVNQQYPD